jgi:transposase
VKRNTDVEATIVGKFVVMSPLLDERARRLWAAAESAAIGYGGDALVSAATGLARETIRNGRKELAQGVKITGRIRQPGAGRPDVEETQPGVTEALDLLVEPLTRGDPMSPLRWTCKSRAKLTATLAAQGWRVSSSTVGRLLHALGYSLQALQKRREGTSHPDRNAQFEHINATAAGFLEASQPVISVDTKTKELVGDFKNAGQEWQPTGVPDPYACMTFPAMPSAKPFPMVCTTWRATKRG